MEIRYFDSQIDFFEHEDEFINSPNDEVAMAVLKQTEAIYNENSGCNLEYCNANGIKAYKGKINTMGTGVVTKGSIVLTVKKKMLDGGEALTDMFSKALAKYLEEKGLTSVRQDNNDIMVDGMKVASGGEIVLNGFNYMGYQISINQDLIAIKNICSKPMVKLPAPLSKFGVTTREIISFCRDYFEKL
jgi:hypothetical protein